MKRPHHMLLVLLSILWYSSGFAPTSKNARAILRTSKLRISVGVLAQNSQKQTMLGAAPRKARGSMLYMHGGHSHGHHDHAHGGTKEVTAVSAGADRIKKRRQAALFLFVTLAILGPPLVRNRMLGRSDVAAFIFTSTALLTFDNVRREVKAGIRKIRDFRDGIVKHSPYQVSAGGALNYLFRNDNAADRVTLLGGVINLVLSGGKFAVGVTCHSSALIADAGHSLSDLFSDFITLWAVQVGRLPPDDDHPYGHGKFEAVGSLFLALTLLGTGLSVGAVSNRKLIEIIQIQRASGFGAVTSGLARQIPTAPALIMAALSIFSKEWLYRITRQVGEKLNSQIVIANAWHHRSDAYSSILALIAIGLAMYFPVFIAADSAAGLLVAGMICMTGADIMGESIKQLTDTSNVALVEQVSDLVASSPDVFDVKRIRTRQVGSSAIVDVAITTHGDLPSSASRNIEEKLRMKIIAETGAVDAEVHATTKDVVCPLLMATENDNYSDYLPPTNSEIEHDVRQQILLTSGVDSVQGISVRYADSILTNVDVVIRVDPDASVANANTVADELRNSLENLDKIHKASIFLDLNQNLSTATAVAVVVPEVAESIP